MDDLEKAFPFGEGVTDIGTSEPMPVTDEVKTFHFLEASRFCMSLRGVSRYALAILRSVSGERRGNLLVDGCDEVNQKNMEFGYPIHRFAPDVDTLYREIATSQATRTYPKSEGVPVACSSQ